jgi:hypothetical protein
MHSILWIQSNIENDTAFLPQSVVWILNQNSAKEKKEIPVLQVSKVSDWWRTTRPARKQYQKVRKSVCTEIRQGCSLYELMPVLN